MGRTLTCLALALSAVTPSVGETVAFRADPPSSRVTFTLDATAHTVEGSFALRSALVTLDPSTGALSGEIVVDLTSGKTGNDRRDRKMQEEVLESATYPTAVLRPNRVAGTVPSEGSAGLRIEGTLSLHGTDHAVTFPARVTVDGPNISVVSEFRVPYVEWGLEDPSVFVLRVAKEVAVRVELNGTLSAPADSSER